MTRVRTIAGTTAALEPFDFARTLDFLRGFPPTLGKFLVVGDGLYWSARVVGCTVLFRVRSKCAATDGVLDYTLHTDGPGGTGEIEQDPVEWLRWLLSLDDDLGDFYGLAQNDPDFAPVDRELHGYHHAKFGSPFEAATWAIVSQRNRLSTARKLYQSFLKTLGHRIRLEEHDYWAFPDPQEIAPLVEAGRPLTPQDVERISNEYGRWRGYWAHYLRVWAQNREQPRCL